MIVFLTITDNTLYILLFCFLKFNNSANFSNDPRMLLTLKILNKNVLDSNLYAFE